MCGIVGVFRLDGGIVDEHVLLRARDRLLQRGPDDAGLEVLGPVGLGHRRLSIIDLSAQGRMPMANETERVWAVFNGEIYNFQVLRSELVAKGHTFRSHTDSEVAIHAYEEWGTDCFARFDGMFALAIWDADRRQLILARDITGEKPLFYAHRSGRSAVFGSSLAALLEFPEVARVIDRNALVQYMGFGFVPAPNSIVENVRKVEPGSFVIIDEKSEPVTRRYWRLEDRAGRERNPATLDEATEQLDALFREVVRSRTIADVPVGAFLSGGIDSSLVVAMLAKTSTNLVRTFTIGFQDSQYDESEHAHRIAKHLGVENTMIVLSAQDVLHELPTVTEAFDEPMADYSALPSLAVARVARRHVKVALTGDGADEAFGGYRYYGGTQMFERFAQRLPRRMRGAIAGRAGKVPFPRLRRAIERASVADAASYFGRSGFYRGATANGSLARILGPTSLPAAEDVVAEYVRAQAGLGAAEAGMLWDATHTLPDAWLAKVDRTTMAVSLEARAPFLARSVLEYGFSLPLEMRIRGTARKIILRRVLARYVPPELFERPKQGFTAPLRSWFANELHDELNDRLSAARVQRFGVFEPDAVQQLLMEQKSGAQDHTQLLWALFHLDRWYETYIERAQSA